MSLVTPSARDMCEPGSQPKIMHVGNPPMQAGVIVPGGRACLLPLERTSDRSVTAYCLQSDIRLRESLRLLRRTHWAIPYLATSSVTARAFG